jgi:hypothetical protein
LDQPIGDIRIGWLTYLTDLNVRNFLPQDVHTESYYSGILIQIAESPVSENNVQGIEKMREIISVLGPHGFLQNPKKMPRKQIVK